MTMKVVDFRRSNGLVVKRSPHYFKSRCTPKAHPDRTQLGVVVDVVFYEDARGGSVCFPVVFWEGAVSASTTHPSLAVPYRRSARCAWVEIAELPSGNFFRSNP